MPIGVALEPDTGKSAGSESVALPGSGEAVPAGIEAILGYNEIELNNRNVLDKYRITEIEGLGDADIRDNRENNPSLDGETAFRAYYGGRNITLTGRIEAHNLGKLRDMQQSLKAAFSNLEESPLYFLTGNPEFDHYINCRKSQPLVMGEVQKSQSYYRDFIVSLRASNPRFLGQNAQTVIIYPNAVPNPSFETNTTGWTKTSTSWTSSSFERSAIYAQHGSWGARFTGTKDATSTERELMIRTTTGASGMPVLEKTKYTLQMATEVRDAPQSGFILRIDWYKSSGSLISTTKSESSNGPGVKTVRMVAESPAEAAFAAVSIVAISKESSDTVDIVFDAVWFVRGEVSNPGYADVPNVGSYTAQPTIRAHGALDGLTLTNDSNGQSLRLVEGTTIADGTYFGFDIGGHSLYNSLGENKFGSLAQESDWIELEGVTSNQVHTDIENTGTTVNSRVEITYRHSWI